MASTSDEPRSPDRENSALTSAAAWLTLALDARVAWGRRLTPRSLDRRFSVTVVIPCYNYGHYLQQAVESAVGQEGVDVQVIIVDDCSTDGSQEVARQLAARYPQVQLLLHQENMGHIRTYNDGLKQAQGELVVLLSADDVLAPGALVRAAAVFEKCPKVGLVYGYAQDFDGDLPLARTIPRSWTVWAGEKWIARICARGMNIIVNPEAVLRTSLMRELVGYDADLPHAADMDLWLRAAARCDVARINGVDQAFYRIHANNMHSTRFAGVLVDARERLKVFQAFFAAHDLGARGRHLMRLAQRSMAREAIRQAVHLLDTRSTVEVAQPFADLAVVCDPTVRSSWRWRSFEARLARPATPIRRRIVSMLESLRWKVRWRRWRRFGT